ncbi:MAG: ATP-binding protein [Salinivirgaceae bacterium]
MKYIARKNVLEKIRPYIGNSLIKILIGQRRVGKSYVLYQLMDELSQNSSSQIVYINKEDFKYDEIKTYADLINYVQALVETDKNVALFIDEIQEITSFEKALRHFQAKNKYDIYCTGSNSNMLSGELATLLAGRYIQIPIYSLSYPEYLIFHKKNNTSESLMAYLKFGGMPHLINLHNNEEVYYEYLRNVFNTIVLKDIVARYSIRNVPFLQDLIRFLANNLGSIVSAKRISDFLKSQQINVQPRSVQEYLYYLESVFFINRVKRAEIEGRKIFEIGDKFYFEDVGMRNAIIPFQMKDMSKLLENAVYHHLCLNGFTVFVGKMGDKEIDFMAEKNGALFYIQVAYLIIDETTHKREFENLLVIGDNYRKIVISMDEMAQGNYKGIEHWSIRKFLTEFN